MEKFGVEEDEELNKTAEQYIGRCPKCRALLYSQEQTGIKLCPNCGSEPFEKQEH